MSTISRERAAQAAHQLKEAYRILSVSVAATPGIPMRNDPANEGARGEALSALAEARQSAERAAALLGEETISLPEAPGSQGNARQSLEAINARLKALSVEFAEPSWAETIDMVPAGLGLTRQLLYWGPGMAMVAVVGALATGSTGLLLWGPLLAVSVVMTAAGAWIRRRRLQAIVEGTG